ncbi:MAG TPA: hypothetical protein VJR94_05285 [Candidatus Nitrosocosmicus sp.]|nr:hypothetical protein [Candidatus Nitrosocosmicus sp.]
MKQIRDKTAACSRLPAQSRLIVVDPKEVNSIYLSQKAINEYADY